MFELHLGHDFIAVAAKVELEGHSYGLERCSFTVLGSFADCEGFLRLSVGLLMGLLNLDLD